VERLNFALEGTDFKWSAVILRLRGLILSGTP
jgi:hypothetical protein